VRDGGFVERSVQPGGGTIARRGDRPGQHARSGQQHLALDQASGREIDQHARALRGRPRLASSHPSSSACAEAPRSRGTRTRAESPQRARDASDPAGHTQPGAPDPRQQAPRRPCRRRSPAPRWVARGTCRGTARCPAGRRTRVGCDLRAVARSAPGLARRSERTAQAAPPAAARGSGRSSPSWPVLRKSIGTARSAPGRVAPDRDPASRSTAGPPSAVIAGSRRGGR
jgi:hypothetical protein